MTLEEALQKAEEAIDKGYLNPYPAACVVLAKEVKKLRREIKKEEEKQNAEISDSTKD